MAARAEPRKPESPIPGLPPGVPDPLEAHERRIAVQTGRPSPYLN